MTLGEFQHRFEELWRAKYAIDAEEGEGIDPKFSEWWQRERDRDRMHSMQADLLSYAAEVRSGPRVVRRRPNRVQRLFDEMGVDPAEVELEGSAQADEAPAGQGRIMYVERKAGQLTGDARIGRVRWSRTHRTLYYAGKSFRPIKGKKANYVCMETGEDYWISGCKRDGSDRLYGERLPIHIDEDAREEYWTDIRRRPERKDQATA